ncbi:MAG: helix-turn-helix domain-containing protein [Nocardioides sp.]
MPSTIRDLLADPGLGLDLLVAGDVDREIRWVHVTELADASPYLVGDEFVLTAGVWRGRRHSAEGFVQALRSRDVAGIGYGLLEGEERVPVEVRRACDDAGVPLVEVPVRTPFVAISQWFFERLAADRERALRATLQLTSDLLAAAENSSTETALTAVAGLIRRSTGHDVWIADDGGRLLGRAGPAPDHATRQRAVVAAWAGVCEVDGWIVQPVGAGVVPAAVIAVARDDAPDLELRPRIDAARPVVSLVLARERAVKESERRLAGEVISLVLGRQVVAASARMRSYGLDPEQALLSFVCAVGDRENALESAERWLDDSHLHGVVALRGDELMVVIDGGGHADVASGLSSALARALSAIAVGTGSVAEDITGLRRSLVQARQACELGRRRGDGAVVSHDLMGSHSLLLALQDQDDLDAFRETLLAPMEEYDAAHGGALVATLRAFLEAGGRWQETADRLHVHVNTLRNRLARVESLTGRQLDSTPDRVDLWLALQAATAGAHDQQPR